MFQSTNIPTCQCFKLTTYQATNIPICQCFKLTTCQATNVPSYQVINESSDQGVDDLFLNLGVLFVQSLVSRRKLVSIPAWFPVRKPPVIDHSEAQK